MKKLDRRTATLLIAALFLAWGGGALAEDSAPPAAETGGRFILQTHRGDVVTDQDFLGRFLLVFFGYTYCPDVCPTSLQTLADVMDLLGEDGRQVQPLFISVDPARDTPALLGEYVSAFHPSLIGLTGSQAAIESVTRKYRVKFNRAGGEGDSYFIDHTAAIFLMAPDGRYLRRFSHDSTADSMAETLRELFNGGSAN